MRTDGLRVRTCRDYDWESIAARVAVSGMRRSGVEAYAYEVYIWI